MFGGEDWPECWLVDAGRGGNWRMKAQSVGILGLQQFPDRFQNRSLSEGCSCKNCVVGEGNGTGELMAFLSRNEMRLRCGPCSRT